MAAPPAAFVKGSTGWQGTEGLGWTPAHYLARDGEGGAGGASHFPSPLFIVS